MAGPVPPEALPDHWLDVEPMLTAALARGLGEYEIGDIARGLIDGQLVLWIAVEPGRIVACAVTAIEEYPRTRHLVVVLAGAVERGGEAVAAMWPMLEDCARGMGCSWVRFQGRRGWVRSGVLPEGWRHSHDVIGVPVT